MKRTLACMVAAVIALAFAGMILAQTNTPAKPAQSKAPMTGKKRLMAIVESVDEVANSYMVVKYMKADLTFNVDPAAKIFLDRKACQLADIKKGYKVTILYRGGDKKRTAVEIIGQSSLAKPSTK